MRVSILVAVAALSAISSAQAEDWNALGRDHTRNSVSPEKDPPQHWQVKGGEVRRGEDGEAKGTAEDRLVRWQADFPSRSYATPVVSQGLVWIGAAYYSDRQPANPGGSLCCFRESDGALIYERRTLTLESRTHDAGWLGLGGSPLVEGDRLWYVTNRWEIVCLDIGPLLAGKGMPREVWVVDLVKEFGVFPRVTIMGPPRQCSIGPSLGDRIFITTANGIDETYTKVPAPTAPALVCLDKNTGRTLWTDASPGGNVHFSEVSSPLAAEIGGRQQVIVPQGDGWLRSFDPASGKLLWQFDLNRKETILELGGRGNRNQCWSCPVLYEERIYVTTGQEVEHGEGAGRLVCIDPTKSGDISSELAVDKGGKPLPQRRAQAVVAKDGERAVPNPNSGLIWEFDASHADFERQFHRTLSSVAVDCGLVVATDVAGLVHCLDARAGKWHWSYDALATIWSTPLVVDGHVYVADEDGDVVRLVLSADPKLATGDNAPPIVNLPTSFMASPVYANGTLYLPTKDRLYAIGRGREPRAPQSLYVPSPPEVVAEMLKAARVTDKDLVVDLGSGDGRIVVAAARTSGAKGVGYEIDRQLVEFSRDKIRADKLESLVTIHEQDFYNADWSEATVVAAFLYPAALEKLKPQFDKLRPGTRIVTHSFAIPGVAIDETVEYKVPRSRDVYRIYLYKNPLRSEPEQ
ncbi:MAG TPA: PQQ-binding-like beta-propeller repeat protein [Pirellulaceae bacterium]|nr:PQQ-binding-like beta-propeller repeat protein [Pirellulaceae bacterium]